VIIKQGSLTEKSKRLLNKIKIYWWIFSRKWKSSF